MWGASFESSEYAWTTKRRHAPDTLRQVARPPGRDSQRLFTTLVNSLDVLTSAVLPREGRCRQPR